MTKQKHLSTSKPEGYALSSNMDMYYAFGNHIYS